MFECALYSVAVQLFGAESVTGEEKHCESSGNSEDL